jgi:septal ring factor EnvC (AmiA/AmiB activator)
MKIDVFKYMFRVLMVVALIGLINPQSSFAQKDKKQLKAKRQKIAKKISYTKKLLGETKNKKETTLTEYKLLKGQVNDRKSLIRTYNSEIEMLEEQIQEKRQHITQLNEDLLNLKEEYAALIYQSYKARNNYDQWMFLFASDDFYQAYRRMKYLQEFNDYRRDKAEDIQNKTRELEDEIQDLEKKKDERLGVLIVKEQETRSLENDSRKKAKAVQDLKSKERALKRNLQKQQNEWRKLDKEIQRLIELELKNKNGAKGRLPLTPAEQKLSDSFAANIGKLPWPSERGLITSRYGVHAHAELNNLKVDEKGVSIRCEKGSAVRVVFSGKVVKVIRLPQFYAVLIKHGDYYTIYNKLSSVVVSEGDMVTTKQKIGTVWTNPEDGETILSFEVRKLTKTQNPEKWLTPR